MQITLSFDNFTELPYTSGTIQNISSQATVEICQDDTINSGLILGPGEWFSWSNSTIYARSAWDYEPTARCAVVPFKKGGEGGGNEYILPIATKTTLGGVKSSDEDGKITVNSDGTMTYKAPEPTITPVVSTAWATNTTYKINDVVGYGGNVYICLKNHTSSSDFDTDFSDGDWSKVDAPKAGANGYVQSLALGVTGATSSTPYVKSLAINQTNSFILPPIEVLEEAPGESVLVNDLHFDNSDAADFNFDADYVTFDGTMRLKTEYDIPMSTPTVITDGTNTGYISESDNIDFRDWDNVEGVDMG
jgi:hypothetical protein